MRVVIVAEDARSAESVRQALRHAPECRLLGYVEPASTFGAPLRDAKPDLVLIDGADHGCTRRLRSAVPGATLVLLTNALGADHVELARAAGVDAIISKNCPPASVGLLVRELANGRMHLGYQPGRRQAVSPVGANLSAREQEMIRLTVGGASAKTVARHLWVTEQTVKVEMLELQRKLGIANDVQLAHYAH